MKKFIVLGLILFLATGCQSGLEQFSSMGKAKKACTDYGYKEGTKAYADCVKSEKREQDAQFNRSLNSLALGSALLNSSTPTAPSLRTPLNCRTNYFGTTATTRCY